MKNYHHKLKCVILESKEHIAATMGRQFRATFSGGGACATNGNKLFSFLRSSCLYAELIHDQIIRKLLLKSTHTFQPRSAFETNSHNSSEKSDIFTKYIRKAKHERTGAANFRCLSSVIRKGGSRGMRGCNPRRQGEKFQISLSYFM
jgi:hypothetical protein